MPDKPNPRNLRRPRITPADTNPLVNRDKNPAVPADSELKEATAEIATLTQKLAALQKESTEKIASSEERLRAIETEKEAATRQITLSQKRADEAERENKTLSDKLVLVETESSKRLEAAQQQLQDTEKEKTAISQQLTLLQKQATDAEQSRKALAEKVTLLETQAEGRVAAIQKRAQELEKTNKSLTQQVADQTARISEFEKAIEKAAKERKQLTLLEKTLQDTTRKMEAMAAESNEGNLRQLKALQQKLQTLEDEKNTLSDQVTGLIGENRRLAEELEPLAADMRRFREAATKAAQELGQAKSETEAALKLRAELERKVKGLEAERGRLDAQLSLQSRQLKEQGKTPLIPPAKVADLVNNLKDQLGSSMTGMTIRDSELRLKVAFGSAGESQGFVVPTIDSGPEIKENLHEVVVRFDRSISAPSE